MRLSTKSRFAVTAMIDVALREDRGPVSLAAISERHHISLSYLEQLFSKLRQQALVESTRGPGGGYSLARSAEKITMADIVSAVDASSDSEGPAGGEGDSSWMSSDLWSSLNRQMIDYLDSVSLHDLVSQQRERLRRRLVGKIHDDQRADHAACVVEKGPCHLHLRTEGIDEGQMFRSGGRAGFLRIGLVPADNAKKNHLIFP